jgi:peptide/nickel transport system permease protein
VAVAAPLLATSRPWLERGPDGLRSPALRSAVGLRAAPGDGRLVLRAPIPHSPDRVDLDAVLEPPSRRHWLGTDGLGRDLTARIVHGSRVSLAVGLLAAVLAMVVGLPLGAVAGYRGGWVDAVVSRLIEGVLCFPALLLALALLAMSPPWLGRWHDVFKVALVLGVTGWIPVARYLRGEFLRLRGSEMVAAARASGAGHLRLVVRHLLPSAMAPVLVTAAFAVGAAILLEAALSFLGLGVRPPTATWGGLLTSARNHITSAWWLGLFPGVCLFLAVLGCNLLGEGIRDRLDPRRRR